MILNITFSRICWRWYPQELGDVQLAHLPTPVYECNWLYIVELWWIMCSRYIQNVSAGIGAHEIQPLGRFKFVFILYMFHPTLAIPNALQQLRSQWVWQMSDTRIHFSLVWNDIFFQYAFGTGNHTTGKLSAYVWCLALTTASHSSARSFAGTLYQLPQSTCSLPWQRAPSFPCLQDSVLRFASSVSSHDVFMFENALGKEYAYSLRVTASM